MGSTLLVLRSLLESQLDIDATNTSSDPSSTVLNNYINKSIREIVRKDRPIEMMLSNAVGINTTISQNSVSIPSTVYVPGIVYYKNSSGKYGKVEPKQFEVLIDQEGSENYFDSTYTGDPSFYSWVGTSLVFNKYFTASQTNGVYVLGLKPPTTLSGDSDATELPIDYDFLITYLSAVKYYQKDQDFSSIQVFSGLAQNERSELKLSFSDSKSAQVILDPNVFTNQVTLNINNPGVFFS